MTNTKRKRRNSLRLSGYDYSQPGAYFVTMVTHQRENLFGDVADGEMQLNEYGKIVQTVWNNLPNHYPHIELGAFILMPNHAHGIIIINESVEIGHAKIGHVRVGHVRVGHVGVGLRPTPTPPRSKQHGLSEIMRAFKSFSSRHIHETDESSPEKIWQRGFYDHIIRNKDEWSRIHLYIENNPSNWQEDRENPSNFQ